MDKADWEELVKHVDEHGPEKVRFILDEGLDDDFVVSVESLIYKKDNYIEIRFS